MTWFIKHVMYLQWTNVWNIGHFCTGVFIVIFIPTLFFRWVGVGGGYIWYCTCILLRYSNALVLYYCLSHECSLLLFHGQYTCMFDKKSIHILQRLGKEGFWEVWNKLNLFTLFIIKKPDLTFKHFDLITRSFRTKSFWLRKSVRLRVHHTNRVW